MKLRLSDEQKRFSFWRDPLICFLLFALSLPMIYAFARIGFDTHHTGLMYKSALDVSNGLTLFSETFTQYGALTTWIQALFMVIFGRRVTSILLATAVFYAIAYVLLYRVARHFFSWWLSLTATLVTVFLAPFYFWDFHPWASVFALAFTLASLLALLNAADGSRKKTLICAALSGFFAAMTFWCRQPAGIICVLAGILSLGVPALLLWKNKEERARYLWLLTAFLIGALLGVLVALIPILLSGAGKDFYIQSIGAMFNFASDRSESDTQSGLGLIIYELFFHPVVESGQWPILNALWSLLPVAAVCVTIYAVVCIVLGVKRRTPDAVKRAIPYLFYGIFAAGAWHQYYPVACYRHWYWGAFLCVPALILCAKAFVHQLFRLPELAALKHREKWQFAAFLLSLAILFLPNLTVRIDGGIDKLRSTRDMVKMESEYREDLNGLLVWESIEEYYGEYFAVMAELQEKLPDTRIVNGTGNGTFSIFDDNFHPMFVNWTLAYEDFDVTLAEYVAAERPIYIGAEAPAEDYVLYFEPSGWSADLWEWSHKMPANVWLPAELLPQLQ